MSAVGAAWRRIRAFSGHFAALGTLSAVAGAIVVAAPHAAARATDAGLQNYLADQSVVIRDLTFEQKPTTGTAPGAEIAGGPQTLARLRADMPQPVRRTIGDAWYAAEVGPDFTFSSGADLHPEDQRVAFGLRTVTGVEQAVRVVAGRWPANTADAGGDLEVAVSAPVAERLALVVGARFRMTPVTNDLPPADARIVGVFAPVDAGAGIWRLPSPLLNVGRDPIDDNKPLIAYVLTDPGGMEVVEGKQWQLTHSWTYRVDSGRLSASGVDGVIAGVTRLMQDGNRAEQLRTPLVRPLQRFSDDLRAIRGALAAALSGAVAAFLGLVAFVAVLMVQRRRPEIRLLRSRGASGAAVALRALVESALVVWLALALGWAAGHASTGGPATDGVLPVLGVGVVAMLAVPITATRHARRSIGATARDTVSLRPTLRRGVAEVLLMALTAAGLLFLHTGRLGSGVDAFLVVVPVLVSVSAAVLGLRLFPLVLHPITGYVGRLRGAAFFLGVARVGRSRMTTIGPAVVVTAIATVISCATVDGGLSQARDSATDRAVPGDVLVSSSDGLRPETGAALAAAPRVTAVAALAAATSRPVDTAGASRNDLTNAYVLVIDDVALARVRADSGRGPAVPAGLSPASGDSAMGALVSGQLAARLTGRAQTTFQGQRYDFRVAGVVQSFPTVPAGVGNFVVLSWSAVSAQARVPLAPTAFALAGDRPELSAVPAVAELAGQARSGPGAVQHWSGYRTHLDGYGVHPLMAFALRFGMVAGLVSALLALVFLVLAGADERGRLLVRVRALGLSPRQWWIMLGWELGLPVGLIVLAGTAAGTLVPVALGRAMQLGTFAEGLPVHVEVSATLLGVVAVLGLLAALTVTAVETLVNRRRRSGEAQLQEGGI
jgi:putative ABC transport system permease protein